MHVCPSGHEVRSPADRDGQGHCLQCRSMWGAAYRSRQSRAMELALALESHGVQVTRSDPAINIQMLAEALANGYAQQQ